jgi:hypothetical protein
MNDVPLHRLLIVGHRPRIPMRLPAILSWTTRLTTCAALVACGGATRTLEQDAGAPADDATIQPTREDADAVSLFSDSASVVERRSPPPRGCDTDASCRPGEQCVEVVPGGDAVCLQPPPELSGCTDGGVSGPQRGCCSSADCKKGACRNTFVLFDVGGCGLGGGNTANSCDQCSGDSDCSGGVCGPAGLIAGQSAVRSCISASCRVDSDCTAEGDGVCRLFRGGCCPPVDHHLWRAPRLVCVYPSRGCARDDDCAGGLCVINNGEPTCSSQCMLN